MKTTLFLVPKKKGKGFLKYPTGSHHHMTDTYKKLDALLLNEAGKRSVTEIWDDFGMLHINTKCNNFEKEFYDLTLEKIFGALKETFPQITEFKKVGWNELFKLAE